MIFDGNEKNYEILEVKMLSYMLLRGLKEVIDPSDPTDELTGDDIVLNGEAFAELVQFLDTTSLSLIIRDARNNGREALRILRQHYAGTAKPRLVSLYTTLQGDLYNRP